MKKLLLCLGLIAVSLQEQSLLARGGGSSFGYGLLGGVVGAGIVSAASQPRYVEQPSQPVVIVDRNTRDRDQENDEDYQDYLHWKRQKRYEARARPNDRPDNYDNQ